MNNKQNNCKYCNFKDNELRNEFEGDILSYLNFNDSKGCYELVSDAKSEEIIIINKVNYCPNCGRNLQKKQAQEKQNDKKDLYLKLKFKELSTSERYKIGREMCADLMRYHAQYREIFKSNILLNKFNINQAKLNDILAGTSKIDINKIKEIAKYLKSLL